MKNILRASLRILNEETSAKEDTEIENFRGLCEEIFGLPGAVIAIA